MLDLEKKIETAGAKHYYYILKVCKFARFMNM